MARKILLGVATCGALLVIGTVGQMECNVSMSSVEQVVRFAIGFGMIFVGVFGHDFLCKIEQIRRAKMFMSKRLREEIKKKENEHE